MSDLITVRATNANDLAAVDGLLARSYPVLLKQDYPPSVMVTAVPLISRARRQLVTCGTYFLAEGEEEHALGAGGWTPARSRPGWGEIRHVVVDPNHVRRGIATALLECVFQTAAREGVTAFECLSTRTAVPFYHSVGFVGLSSAEIPLAPGISFPVVRMARRATG